jgi:hypothetical protein
VRRKDDNDECGGSSRDGSHRRNADTTL